MYSYKHSICAIDVSGVRHQPLVVLAAVGGQISRIHAVVAHMPERDASGREASAGLFVACAFVSIVADVNEGEFF
jgi:hypothetical protein